MLNTKEHFNQLDAIAVTELDNETAAAIQGGAALELYKDTGVLGASGLLGSFNIGGRATLSSRANDEISSVLIKDGEWEFYEDANYKGRSITFTRGRYDLVLYPLGFGSSWNDKISSFKRID
ncbi:beta/gamma crystallin-related protein [Nostoc sp. ChiSLP03a]|uniref:beta/gamma crystallin-related protein n=1 Tax=Nostoc sp. ChiSLP03a TaxID=3075380 RepID=UPI002AD41474|nr:beta/gamma crystallin-related protein [Nostoc sp. ChiSLP03a]MDZ8216247.1 beta/gamma crystallin-related protein [Nostoc sp. ChiSLP03a]